MAETLLHNVENRMSELLFQLQYVLNPIEERRLELKKRSRNLLLVFIVALLMVGGLYAYIQNPYFLWGFALAVIAYIILYFLKVNSPKNILIEDYQKNVVPHIINEFLADACFEPDNCISSSEYWDSGLFNTHVDRYNGNNYISGTLGKTSLKFSVLHTQYKTQTRTKNGGTRTTWHTIFKGLFLVADSNKHFQGETYIFPDSAERALGGIGRWFQEKVGALGRGEMVYMEDTEFEKRYVVYATDPVEARYLLTPAMQEYFVKIANYLGVSAIHASFVKGKLYLAVSGNYNLFAFKMNRCLIGADTIKYYAQDMLTMLTVVEMLNLNTRIWGK